MISLDKAIELCLSTLATEGKSPRYIDWLRTRLRFFSAFIRETQGKNFKVQDLTVDDGRDFIRHLMDRKKKYHLICDIICC